MSSLTLLLWLALAALAIIVIAIAVRFQRTTIYDYQRGLRYRDGRFTDLVEPGAHWTFGPTTFIRIVDIRTSVFPIAGQELVTSDGVTVKVSLAVQRRLVDPVVAINDNEDYFSSTYSLIQVALRETVGTMAVEEVLQRRSDIGSEVLRRSRDAVRELGVELVAVDVKDLMLPAATKKLLGQVVDARQRGLATLEKARGETAALRSLANAARMVESNPSLLQLRLLQQLESTSGNTVLLGMPTTGTPVPVRQVPSATEPADDSTAGGSASLPERE
jgi:regulator of protease activity HflC (stomatin/prohibitin superfamily)